ncbi:hypothetical protein T484DRAFT_3632548, partial [Baffinella frigidus]
ASAQAAALLKQLAPAAAITPGAWLHPGEGSAGGPYLGCLSSAHAVLTERPVPAMMDVSLATEVRMRKVGKVTAGRVACLLQVRPSTLNPTPSTLNPQPSTLNPNPQLSTLDPQPPTLNHKPSTVNPQPLTRHPQPSTLNPRPSTLNPQPSTINLQP